MSVLVTSPILRDDQHRAAASSQGPGDLAEHTGGLAHMFQRHYVQAGIEALLPERERMEVRHCIETTVVPIRVAQGEIDSAIAVIAEKPTVCSFACARIEDSRTLR